MFGKRVRLIDKILGVIDLKNGAAVHAVAGHRDAYKPMDWCDGSPLQLADHYRRLGLTRIYVADLDSILGGSVQSECLIEIADRFAGHEILVDVGWRGDDLNQSNAVKKLYQHHDAVNFIAATESVRSNNAIHELASLTISDRVFLGLDILDDALVGIETSESRLIRTAVNAELAGIVVLDIKQVGTRSGPVTAPRCRRIKMTCPSLRVYTGGGIRSLADVASLIDADCDACLVGTMLHPL